MGSAAVEHVNLSNMERLRLVNLPVSLAVVGVKCCPQLDLIETVKQVAMCLEELRLMSTEELYDQEGIVDKCLLPPRRALAEQGKTLHPVYIKSYNPYPFSMDERAEMDTFKVLYDLQTLAMSDSGDDDGDDDGDEEQ